jgi:hypothetical protein
MFCEKAVAPPVPTSPLPGVVPVLVSDDATGQVPANSQPTPDTVESGVGLGTGLGVGLSARLQANPFPVYDNLAAKLIATTSMPDPVVAHVLAVASAYAYSDAATESMMLARMGLTRNHCMTVSQNVDGMFIDSSAHLLQSSDGSVAILAYRGTRPTNALEWLSDSDVYPAHVATPFPGSEATYSIHSGFYRNVLSTRYEVVTALTRALEGRSVLDDGSTDGPELPNDGLMQSPLKALYVTGHSLGGAMASLLTVMLAIEPVYSEVFSSVLRGVYTFGQPMVGSPAFAAACNGDPFLRSNVVRYVYRKDPVPSLPPRETDPFAHFGQEFRYTDQFLWTDHSDHPVKQIGLAQGLIEAPFGYVAKEFRRLRGIPLQFSFYDHSPANYISSLTPPGMGNELGDKYLVPGN